MYAFMESLRSAMYAIRAHKLRSFLTTLGIIIGVMAVVTVVSLIQGFSQSISSQFAGFGTDSLTVHSYLPFKEQLQGKTAYITPDDMLAIQHEVPGISGVTPMLQLGQFGSAIQYKGQASSSQILGVTQGYASVFSQYPDQGRFITPSDDLTHRRVAVIGQTVVDNLHLPANPLGEYFQIGDQWFEIVGLLHKQGSILGQDQDNNVLIPYGTAHSLIGGANKEDIQIELKVNDTSEMDVTADRIRQVLHRRHDLKPGQDDDFKVQTTSQFTDSFKSILDMLTLVLGGIVGVSLLVGGIGIMNIMLVSVTERTREIGILKSLGARRSDILVQFLLEAVALSMLGGIIGLILGYGIGSLIVYAVPAFRGAHVPMWAALVSIGFSTTIGIIFGITPAAKAAALNPIDALRYE
ncbi:MAG TPA: ABC transporter permease [Gammaproteobacteria bacterium]|jgi:putative ABC transport system permease protein|nr:ABC transporter permease [Gammaproteobacteria bacterium]